MLRLVFHSSAFLDSNHTLSGDGHISIPAIVAVAPEPRTFPMPQATELLHVAPLATEQGVGSRLPDSLSCLVVTAPISSDGSDFFMLSNSRSLSDVARIE